MIDNLLDINLHEYYIISAYSNRYICNDECEIFEDMQTGDIIIHPNEDETIVGDMVEDIWAYDKETLEYKHIYHKEK